MFEPLPDDLAIALEHAVPRLGPYAELHYRTEIGSTNDVALSLALAGAPEGTSVLAGRQLAGRGRRGRDWFSPPGAGLYLSVIVRPDLTDGVLPIVTLAAGVAGANAVRAASGLPVELKWPNDLVIGRPWRKLGGVLSEAATAGSRIDAVIIGVGINLRQASYPPSLAAQATSVELELGRSVERAPLVVELLGGLRETMEQLARGDRSVVCHTWRALGQGGLAGAVVQWRDQSGNRRGLARDIADDGALLVETGGRIERVIAGEVTWESWARDSTGTR